MDMMQVTRFIRGIFDQIKRNPSDQEPQQSKLRTLWRMISGRVQYRPGKERDLSLEAYPEGSIASRADEIIDAAKARWEQEERGESGDGESPAQEVTGPSPLESWRQTTDAAQPPPVIQPPAQSPSPAGTPTQPPPSSSQALPPALSERARNAGWGNRWQPPSPAESQPPADVVVPPKSPQGDTTTTVPADQAASPPPVAQPAGNANPAPTLDSMVAKYGQPDLGRYSKLPEFYYERDEAGNRMVDLLALRDQAKGAAAKRDIKLHIDAWTRQYDKLSRGSKVGKPITGPAVDAWQAARSPASDSPQSGTSPADSPSSPPGIGSPTPTDIIKAELNPNRQQAAADNNPEVSRGSTAVDSIQAGLDAVGVVGDAVVPGLGVAADGVNAVMSLGRAVTDPGRAGQHLSNAAISAVSMVPLIGDSAKLLKAGQYSKLAGRVADAGKSRRAGEAVGSATAAASGASTGMTGGGSGGGGANGGTGSPGPGDEGERGGGFMDAVSSATDTLLRFVGPVGKLIIGFETIYASLQAMNAGVLALNRDLAEYNGNVAATYAMSDAHEIERKVERGESLSGPLDRLAKQQREANEIRDSIMNPLMNIGIDILAMITWIANQVQEILLTLFFVREILDILIWMKDWIISWFGASGSNNPLDDLPAAQQFFTDLMDGKLDGKMPSFFTMGGSQ